MAERKRQPSHDLQEPLRAIAGFAQLLDRRYADEVGERGKDILRSDQLEAAAYAVKPVDFDQFVTAVRAIDSFWFDAVTYTRP